MMKVEFSLSHNAKFDCAHVFGVLSNQCKNLCQFAMPLVLSTLHVVYITTHEQNVHKTNAHVANKNIRQFAKPYPSRVQNTQHKRVCGEQKHSPIGLCVNAL